MIFQGMTQLFFSFVVTVAFAIIANVSRYVLVQCGLTGMAGWMTYWLLIEFGVSMAISALAGSIVVAFISNCFSRHCKMPVTVFNIPGIMPLVPGVLAYEAVRSLVQGDYAQFMHIGVDTVMVAGAIALGLILAEVFHTTIQTVTKKFR